MSHTSQQNNGFRQTMLFHNKQTVSKRLGIWVLMLFVVSWMNISMQSPAHAAMQSTMQKQIMGATMDTEQCHCPPSLCEAVLSLDNQSTESSFTVIDLDGLLGFQSVIEQLLGDLHHTPGLLRFHHSNWQYRQFSPPPISLTSILLI